MVERKIAVVPFIRDLEKKWKRDHALAEQVRSLIERRRLFGPKRIVLSEADLVGGDGTDLLADQYNQFEQAVKLAQRVRMLLERGWGLVNPNFVNFAKGHLVRYPDSSTCEIITTEAELMGEQAADKETMMTEAEIEQENNNRLAKGVRRLIGMGNLFIWRYYSSAHETCHHEKVVKETELIPKQPTEEELGPTFVKLGQAKDEEEERDANYKYICTYERVFRGTTYIVQMDEDGLLHCNGKHYRSLAEAAVAITGSKDVVGYDFFRGCEITPRDGADEKERDADRELGKQVRKLLKAGRLAWSYPSCGFSIQDVAEFMSQRR